MSQLGEPVAVAMADDLVDECPFSHDDNPPSKTNDLTNNPSKLGTNLKGGDAIQIKVKVRTNVRTMECGFGAHHVIPGDASLNKSSQLLPWMKKGDLKSDIGYGVNHANNGIWLPGNYGWDPKTVMKWGKLAASGGFEIQFGYAYAAMTATQRQFHDAHPVYSTWVRLTLEKMRVKMLEMKTDCSHCDKKNNKKPYNPPFKLVGMLDGLSERLRGKLRFPASQWVPPFYTSEMSVLMHTGMTPDSLALIP
jgi:hypothetical protein